MQRFQLLPGDQVKLAVGIAPFFFAQARLDDMPAPPGDADGRFVDVRRCRLVRHEHAKSSDALPLK